jgi:hypothetical protein
VNQIETFLQIITVKICGFCFAAFSVCLLFGDAVAFSVFSRGRDERPNVRLHLGRSDEIGKTTFVHSSRSRPNLGFVVKRHSAEDYLHQVGIVPLNRPGDLRDDIKGFAPRTAIYRAALRPKHLSAAELASVPIFVVSGSDGDHRRSFAVTVAATYGLKHIKQSKCVTLYLNLWELSEFRQGKEDLMQLVTWIKREISKTCGSSEKLNMHISLVIEPRCWNWDGFFEQRELLKFLELLKEDVADSIRLVLCGVGYTDEDFPTGTNSFLIHCRDDLQESALVEILTDKAFVVLGSVYLGSMSFFFCLYYLLCIL